MTGKPEEFYIYPSSKVSNFLFSDPNESAHENDESIENVLIRYEDNVIKEVQQDIDANILQAIDKGRIIMQESSHVVINDDKGHVKKKAKKTSDKSTSDTKRDIKVHTASNKKEISAERPTHDVTPTKKTKKRKVLQSTQDEIIHSNEEKSLKKEFQEESYSMDQSTKPSDQPPSKKSKSKKDKNEPKRAPSAYILFCNDKRPGIIEENPNIDQVEIMRKMGELWRAAGDDIKAKYAKKSKNLSAIANEKIQAYRKEKQDASNVDHDEDSGDGGEMLPLKQKRRKGS